MALGVARASTLPALAAGDGSRRLREVGQAGRDWFRAGLAREAEQRRLFPWLAVAFGIGILLCFSAAEGRPHPWAPLAAAALVASVLPALRARPVAMAAALGLLAAILGFAAATIRMGSVTSPVLSRVTVGPLRGVVESLEERESGLRLIVRIESFAGLDAAERPLRARVSYRSGGTLKPGDGIAATARLLPPPEAARPGGYDFSRDARFRGIGAVGSLLGKVEINTPAALPWRLRTTAAIDDARNVLTRRIADATGGQAGAVAAALVTGKRGLIGEETNAILRAAGIYHVVSISGLHMVLAAGVVFFLARALLALAPVLALCLPIKKLSAGLAMLGVTAYCAFSGWDVAAERALVMTLVMLGAILIERPALSMRNLAVAALIVLAREPEALLGPSFQMSFGAVAGLIACAPLVARSPFRGQGLGWLGRRLDAFGGALVATLGTTLVAQVATAPFATYHFQTIQPFGLLGNALTLPLVSFAVMPSAVIGMLAYPFALDQPVWWLMGQAVAGMLAISGWISGFGQANLVVPAFGAPALGCLAAALLLATLPASSLRWLCLAPALIGIAFAAHPPRYDVFVDRDGSSAAVRGAHGRLVPLGLPHGFVLEQWLRADGDARSPGEAATEVLPACDKLGCTLRTMGGRWVALVKEKRAFAEDCARADILISRLQAPPGCAAKTIIDRRFLAAHGATAIRLDAREPVLVSARQPNRHPPWRAPAPVAAKPREVEPMNALGGFGMAATPAHAEPDEAFQ